MTETLLASCAVGAPADCEDTASVDVVGPALVIAAVVVVGVLVALVLTGRGRRRR